MYNILYIKYIAFCRFMFETGKTICQRCKKIKSLLRYILQNHVLKYCAGFASQVHYLF